MDYHDNRSQLKREIIQDWGSLINKMNEYFQLQRNAGGTAGHKTGHYFQRLVKLFDSFYDSHKYG